MLKRAICILVMLVCFSQSCFAQNIVFEEVVAEKHIPLGGVLIEYQDVIEEADEYGVSPCSDLEFDEYIVESAMNLKKEIEVSRYGMSYSEFYDAYMDTVMKNPQTLLRTIWSSSSIEGIVQYVTPMYLVESAEEAEAARTIMNTAVQEYVALANKYDTDLEKLLVIHDKMVADCDYDVRVLDNSTKEQAPDTVYHALGVLRDKFAVCQGYSQALYMIAKELGIELDFCVSDEKNHIWNYVNLDGKWYHMDMTNDDPVTKDSDGNTVARTDTTARHIYFMVSETGLDPEIHGTNWRRYGGETYECTDTRYESDHLFNVIIPFTAVRAEDGYFHVSAQIESEELGIAATEVDFKSESLYTGAMLSRIIAVERFSENGNAKKVRGLYVIGYPTRDIENAMPIVRLDGANQIAVGNAEDISRNAEWYLYFNAEIPEGISISFTAFLWDAATLTPYAMKTTWSQQ